MQRILLDDVDIPSGDGAADIDVIAEVVDRELLERLPLA